MEKRSQEKTARRRPSPLFCPIRKSEDRRPSTCTLPAAAPAQEWQGLLTYDLLAVNKDGPWVHTKFVFWFSDGTEKEVVLIRELYGLDRGEHILHTAHRTTTSTSASRRFFDRLMAVGYEEVIRVKRGEKNDMAMCFGRNFG